MMKLKLSTEALKLEQKVLINSNDTSLASSLLTMVAKLYDKERAIEYFVNLQVQHDEPLASILLELTKMIGATKVSQMFPPKVDSLRSLPAMMSISGAWKSFCRGDLIDSCYNCLDGIDEIYFDLWFSLIHPEPQRVTIEKLSKDGWRLAGEDLSWLKRPFEISVDSEDLRNPKTFNNFRHQDIILEAGWLQYNDLEGNLRRCIDSFMYYDRIFYTFSSPVPWAMVSGVEAGVFSGVFIPPYNCIIQSSWMGARAVAMQSAAAYYSNILKRLGRAAKVGGLSKQASEVSSDRSVIACVSGVENFAHQVWNSFSGLDRIIRQDILNHIKRVDFFGTEFFGKLSEIFPELAQSEILCLRHRGIGRNPPFSQDSILVNIGSISMSQNFIKRIVGNAKKNTAKSNAVKSIAKRAFSSTLTICIVVRDGDKSWAGQEDGVIHLINKVNSIFPNIFWLIDAFSKPSGVDCISEKWADFSKITSEIIGRITDALPEAQIASMSGLTLNEAITLAQSVDIYVSPIGTAQHKIGWFSDAVGIVYASTKWQVSNHNALPGFTVIEGKVAPKVIFGEPVGKEDLSRGVYDQRKNLEQIPIM